MSSHTETAPARRVLEEAVRRNDQLGHDNLGSLSYSHGFLPRVEPLNHFPASHRAWDEIATAVPALFRAYAIRQTVDEMPLLSAAAAALPDQYLLRAASFLGIMAHLYWHTEPEAPAEGIPPQIQLPWAEVARRLDRPAPHLSFIDLNSHNWQFIDPQAERPFTVENLRLAIPMAGNEDERRFQTAPIELLHLFAPLMETVLTAQEAVLRDDPRALEEALAFVSQALNFQSFHSLMKVNPNPYNDLYINPVVWGKTAALFASPFQPDNSVPGPSGTYIPSFNTLDIFFGRKQYRSTVGHETDRTRRWFPRHWRDWLDALEQVSITDYVAQKESRTLQAIYHEARDAYAGENGLLSRHRLKAYGFLDLSFKAGRVKTLGGVSGSYSERIWDRMAIELDEARLERYAAIPRRAHKVTVKRVETLRDHPQYPARRAVLDISGAGLRYEAGDRCAILPENSAELIAKTVRALRATGEEPVRLNAAWRQHVNLRDGYEGATELPLRLLLQFGRIRPVDRVTALNLHRLHPHPRLQKILDAWAEDQWELWDLLETLKETGYNTRRLWKAAPGDYEHICRLVQPERPRLYSISSTLTANPGELHLTAGGLVYQTEETEVSRREVRRGTGSSFLARLHEENAHGRRVSIQIVHPPRFSLPQDVTRPLVMFAGGTGVAPMRGMIAERLSDPTAAPIWLFLGVRQREDFYYRQEFAPWVAAGRLHIGLALSREEATARFNQETGQFEFQPGQRQYVDALMLQEEYAPLLWEMLRGAADGGQGAYFYLCGRTAFADSVLTAVKAIIERYAPTAGHETLYRLVGEDRFMLEIFTTYTGSHFDGRKESFHISDVVVHNNDADGYWMIINGRVYDINEFNHLHPGGPKILQSYAGMDGTIAYQKVDHHINSEVDAMLGMYELGVLRTPDFGQAWGAALSDKGVRFISLRDLFYTWVDVLYMVVEIENAVLNDFRIRNEPFTEIEADGPVLLTPVKVQQLVLAHERLATGYLEQLLGEPMSLLWAQTSGMFGYHGVDVRWMSGRLTEIRAAESFQAMAALSRQVREGIKGDDGRLTMPPEAWSAAYAPFCAELERVDCGLLRELKLALREGTAVFEQYEARAGEHSEALMAVLQRIPEIVAAWGLARPAAPRQVR